MNFSGTYDDFFNKSQSTYNDYISKLKNLDTKEQTFKDQSRQTIADFFIS